MPQRLDHIDAHPLQWPDLYERTPPGDRSRWPGKTSRFGERRDELIDEIEKTADQGSTFVLSTNIQTYERAGRPIPYANQPEPDDPGVAVYLIIDGEARAFACDAYTTVAGNVAAVRLTLEQLRRIASRGVNEGRRAYQGFPALPAPDQSGGPKWWNVLGVDRSAPYADIRSAWRRRAAETHPDRGGDKEAFYRVKSAWKQAKAERTQHSTP